MAVVLCANIVAHVIIKLCILDEIDSSLTSVFIIVLESPTIV